MATPMSLYQSQNITGEEILFIRQLIADHPGTEPLEAVAADSVRPPAWLDQWRVHGMQFVMNDWPGNVASGGRDRVTHR